MITIKQLNGIKFEVIHEAFRKAFSDYIEPFDLTIQELKYMVERRGCDLNLSFGAFDNDELVGFTLNGIGIWNGNLTAYDTGTGIIKEYRKKGIATRIFNESLPILKKNNICQYLLEVIRTNTSAFDLYRKAGFKITREFDYYISEKKNLRFNKHSNISDFAFKEILNPNWELLKTFWDFEPSWQNSIDSVNRKINNFKILGVYGDDRLIGYGIIENNTGDIPQLAVSKKQRRLGISTLLFQHLVDLTESSKIKIINSEASYLPFKKFAENINLIPGIGQYEMLLEL